VRPEPTRIEPIFSPRLWGARSLAPFFPEKSNLTEPLGEAWLTGVNCRIGAGQFAGKSLGAAWTEMPVEWRGTSLASIQDFPLLVKFIFPTDKLSIQVHPDDAYAAVHEQAAGGRGKTEMWHAVSAEDGASVLIGLIPKADKAKFLESLSSNTIEDLFVHWRVQPGDSFFVPSGTPHTIGKGMVLCEVQQYSDLTYRVYDYGRTDAQGKSRELHIKKALDVIQFSRPIGGKVSRIALPGRGFQKLLLLACCYFATERWKDFAQIEIRSDNEHFDLLVILSGDGHLSWTNGSAEYQPGECWLIPAGLGDFTLRSKKRTKLLRTYIPNLEKLKADLRRQGLSENEIAKTVFG
jgi:mannose-6-phosphate isomerase